MKKKVLLSMALLSAIVTVGSAPLTAYAAEAKTVHVQVKNGKTVIIGQGIQSLRETLKELGVSIGNNGNFCPDTNVPDTEKPGTNAPDTNTPDVEKPGTNVPDTNKPDTSTPDIEKPGTNTPDTEKPSTSVPDGEKPGTDTPDADKPDTSAPDTSEETVLSYAEQVAKLVNIERAKAGLPELAVQTDITAAANVRAKEIKTQFSHTRPDGSSFSTVLKDQGISFRGAGENIAWGQKSPEAVMNAWMNSDGHRANILNKNYKNIGVGYYQDENGVNYWVQLFTY